MQYENKYYNSFLEDGKSMLKRELLAERLTNLATLVGKVVYKLISGEALHPSEKANSATVKALLTCYLNDSNCDLFQQVQDPTLTSTLSKYPVALRIEGSYHCNIRFLPLQTQVVLPIRRTSVCTASPKYCASTRACCSFALPATRLPSTHRLTAISSPLIIEMTYG